MNECPKYPTSEPCQHMFSMTLRNGDRVCRRCHVVKRLKPQKTPMPSADDLLGIDPNWTGGLSTDEYMQQQRSRG